MLKNTILNFMTGDGLSPVSPFPSFFLLSFHINFRRHSKFVFGFEIDLDVC